MVSVKPADSIIGYFRDCRFSDAFALLALLGYVVAFKDYYFFFDDFYYLDKAIRDPAGALFTPQEAFLYRPLSQYGFFGLGYSLFGTHAAGYYFLSLAISCLIVISSYGIARSLGFAPLEARIACSLFLLSPPLLECLVWLSNVQHSLDILFVLLMLRLEIRWLENRRAIYKILGVVCFGLGIASNIVVVIVFPLLLLVYVRYSMRTVSTDLRELARGLFAIVLPSLLLLGAFFAVYRQAPAHQVLRAGLDDPSSPYYVEVALHHAVANLGFFLSRLFPYGVVTAPLMIVLVLSWAARWFLDRREGSGSGREAVSVSFAVAWALVSVSPFLFLVKRVNANMALLAAVSAYPFFVTSLLSPLRELLGRLRLQWLVPAALFALLAHHGNLAYEHLTQPQIGGKMQRAGIVQINQLVQQHFPGASKLYLVNYRNYRLGRDAQAFDWVRASYGLGTINPVFVGGRRIEFLTENVDRRIARLQEGEGVIFYHPNFHFFVPGARATDG